MQSKIPNLKSKIGVDGAGKSTLLKILSRITEPTGGHAEIHGRVGSLLEVSTGFHPIPLGPLGTGTAGRDVKRIRVCVNDTTLVRDVKE